MSRRNLTPPPHPPPPQATSQFSLLTARQEIGKLQQQVVRSPERLKRELESLAASAETEKEESAAVERRARDLAGRHEVAVRTLRDVERTSALLEEAAQELEKAKEAARSVKHGQAKIKENKAAMVELETKEQHTQRQIARAQERLGAFRRHADVKSAAAEQAMEAAKEELTQISREHAEERSKAEQTAAQVRLFHQRMAEEEREQEREMEGVREVRTRAWVGCRSSWSLGRPLIRARRATSASSRPCGVTMPACWPTSPTPRWAPRPPMRRRWPAPQRSR